MNVPRFLPGLLLFASATFGTAVHAQTEVTTGPGTDFHYTYHPREAGEFPAEAIDTGDPQLVYLDEGAAGAAFLYSRTGQSASVTWHFRLTEPGAVWARDAHVRSDVLLIADAEAEREYHFWVLEYSTDGEEFFPFMSTGTADAGEPYHFDFSGAHSGTGPFFLDRGGFEGGTADLFIRVTAVNGWAEGNQMQAFRSDADNDRPFEFRASITGARDGEEVVVTTQETVGLDQSPDDALNGIVGEMSAPLHFTSTGGENNAAFFTNATSASEPAGNVFWNPDGQSYHITWDLGAEVDPQTRQLDEISVWIDAHDPGRRGYRGAFYVSTDGTEFTKIPGSFYSDRLAQGGTGGSPLYNNVRYLFPAGEVIGFRYLRFVSYGIHLGDPFIAQTRYTEIDASVSSVTPPSSGFDDWRAAQFTDDAENDSISGPDADPDGDGLRNLFEYALGLDPNLAGRGDLPVAQVEAVTEADYLTLTYTRPTDIADIAYSLLTAGALGEWEANAVLVDEQDREDGTTTLIYRDAVPVDEAGSRFMRLEVSRSE